MNINAKEIKNTLARGIVLLTLTGTIVSKNPSIVNDTTYVYASSNLETTKNKYITKINSIYKKYNKKYYTEKEYTSLTNYYNSAISEINKCKSNSSVKTTYTNYATKLKEIAPSILVKYQTKVEKSLLKTYKSLIKNNDYSEEKLEELENIKNEGIKKIYATKTKTKAKKAKSACINSLKAVETILDETKNEVIEYIINNNSLSTSTKQAIIENINSLNNVENVKAIGEEYGYGKDEEAISPIVSKVEKQINDLTKKYKSCYTEKEIRCLVATANMDFVSDNEVYTIFNTNSKQELEEYAELFDNLMDEEYYNVSWECTYNALYSELSGTSIFDEYKNKKRKYKDMIKINELFVDENIKKQADFVFTEVNQMVMDPASASQGYAATSGTRAGINIGAYIFDNYTIPGRTYEKPIYKYTDSRLTNTAAGIIINKYACSAAVDCFDRPSSLSLPKDGYATIVDYIDEFKNPISEFIKKTNSKIKK